MNRKIGTALVVGAGISGIRAALDLAENGYGVTLIDRSPHMGGILSQLDYQFPTDRCGMCKMLPLIDRDASSQHCLRKGLFHENIDILLSTDLVSVEGEPGKFEVMLRQKQNWVDPKRCIGCGACVEVCPVEAPDAFNAGLSSRKAIYLPVPHAIPNTYVIDSAACNRCGACESVCPVNAVSLSQEARKAFRILVVDDEQIIRDSLKAWLEDEEGFTVVTAESGPAALEAMGKQTFHLMLLDIKMPGMDGVEVLKKTKDGFPQLDVLMMTAYATVETAVEAMKIGAMDYLIKPFDTDDLIPKIVGIYQDLEASKGKKIEVGAILLCGGTDFYNPAEGKNPFGYQTLPHVVTSLEFERILSGTGPFQGRFVRPGDEKPIRKIAWIQCVGSRDLQLNADFCSNICCMFAIKEALLAKEKGGAAVETTIFYMDMRTFEKSFQRYRDEAETVFGVRFVRGRVHSVVPDENHKDAILRYVDPTGALHTESFDLVVLAAGQRPAADTEKLAELVEIPINQWGFCRAAPFSMTRTDREGIVLGGAFSGMKDIGESVIQASAAAFSASRVIHAAGGGLAPEPMSEPGKIDVSREVPRILTVICTCGARLSAILDKDELAKGIKTDPEVSDVVFLENTCTRAGWEELVRVVDEKQPNRILIGACLPYVFTRKIRELGEQIGLAPSLMDVVDISPFFTPDSPTEDAPGIEPAAHSIRRTLEMGLAKVRRADPDPVETVQIEQKALVVGGGIAGMTAALAIADHGFHVDLVEQTDALGGNLLWLKQNLEGESVSELLSETLQKVEKQPLIAVHTETRVLSSYGEVGAFFTTLENKEGQPESLLHAVSILATGGREAEPVGAYGYGESSVVVTQQELEKGLSESVIDPGELRSIVMIQCVGSREEPRNYCSRICCASSIKHALDFKNRNPDVEIYILYRDMMTYGSAEAYYTSARKAGVIFIRYDTSAKPTVEPQEGSALVRVFEPTLRTPVEIEADLVVLATGVVPTLSADLAESFGATLDRDGFFQEAESKWRPVDSLKEGVFACGLSHSPRNITESIATAEAAAQRALRILSRKRLPTGKIVAKVRHSLCSLCQRCIDACPYGARTLDAEEECVVVNPAMCQGCGSCATVCPNNASILSGFQKQQVFDMIDAALL